MMNLQADPGSHKETDQTKVCVDSTRFWIYMQLLSLTPWVHISM